MPLNHTRRSLRPVLFHVAAAALVALTVATCSDDKMNGPSHTGRGYFAFRPVTHLSAPPADFGIVVDSVHLRLTRLPSTVVLDTSAYFPADSNDLHLSLTVPLEQEAETLEALIELKAGAFVVFSGTQSVAVVNGPPGSSPVPSVNLTFVGPGINIGSIAIVPKDTAIAFGDSVRYSATARDSSSNPVTQFYVGWRSSDTTVAKINASGLLRAPTHRGSVRIIGTTPTGITDTAIVTFVPVATILEKLAGDSQTGTVGQAPALPLTVIARAADSLGVAGVPVRFTVLSGGGTVADSLVLTDTLGHAATAITLGTTAGPQKFVATAGALRPDTFTVTAVAGTPSAIAIHAGNAQVDTVGAPMPAPFVAKVTDAFGNAVAGARVVWARIAGGGTLAADTTVSDSTGLAAGDYTLGATPRTDSVKATLAGTPASVTFTVTAVPPAPAAIAIVSGNAQSDTVNKALALPLVVNVTGSGTRPVAGARVAFSIRTGNGSFAGPTVDTVTTDTLGRAQVPFTLGTLAGTDSIEAKTVVGGFTATFHAVALTAAPTVIGVQSGDAQTDTTSTALPNPLVVKVTDAFANPVNGVKVYWTRTGGGTLAADSTSTAPTGLTQVGYTLGGAPRTDTVVATIAGTGFFARMTAVAVPPAPVGIAVLSGSGQTDTVGQTLPQPFQVQVTGAGARPVAGARVVFSFRTGTGTISGKAVDTVATDTAGKAQGTITLGTVSGTNSIQATVIGAAFGPAVIGATAIPDAPSLIAIASGNGQADTVSKALPSPLVVKVTDAHGNAVAGAKVVWSVVSGAGAFSPSDTSTTNAAGQGSVSFTLPAVAGLDSLRATLAGTPAFVNFTATGTSGAPTGITVVSGAAQTDTVGAALPLPLVVRVADGANNPVAGAKVYWTRTAGTGTVSADSTVTDAAGHAQVIFTLGTTAGADSVKAALAGGANVLFGMTGTADAAKTIAATGGNGQSGTISTALPLPLTVKVTDVHGNAVAGTTVTWAVTQGGGSLGGITATTDATGTSTVTTWTLGAAAGTNTVTATVSGLTGSPVTFSAVSLPIGTTKTWTGSAGTAWNTAGSWNPAGVPTASDNVFIPAAAPAPSVTANAPVGGVSLEPGATLTLGAGDTLSAVGTILVPATATVAGSGILGLAGSAQQVSGAVANLAITNTTQLAGPTQVAGAVTISGSGSLTVNGKVLTVGGNVTLGGSGQLVMTNAADSVDVGGTYTAGGASSGSNLSAGRLVLRGGLVQTSSYADNFAASGTHTTIFAGSAVQNVTFAFPGPTQSHFQNLSVTDPAGITLGSDLSATGTVTLTGGPVTGTTYSASIGGGLVDASNARWKVDTTTFLGGGALQLPDSMTGVVGFTGAGTTLSKAFRVTGFLFVTGSGTLAPSGHPLTVTGVSPAGSMAIAGTAQLIMTNPADSVDVAGAFVAGGGPTTGNLSSGKLVLRGSFTQSSSYANNFAASGTHRTIFAGSTAQAVYFSYPGGTGYSSFQDVTFANPAGVTLGSRVTVNGTATVQSGQVTGPAGAVTLGRGLVDAGFGWQADTTFLAGTGVTIPDSMHGSVHLLGADTLTHPFKALGDLSVEGSGLLVPNGNRVTVAGAFSTGGTARFVMANAADSVDVGGTYTANGGPSNGDLSAGKLVLRGNFAQGPSYANDFAASGTHQVIFAGSAPQTLSFSYPGGAGYSAFQDVVFDNAAGVSLATRFQANGSATILAGNVTGAGKSATIGASLVDATSSRWQVDTTTFSGSPALPDSFGGVVHFTGNATLTKPLKLLGAASVDGGGVLTTAGHALTVAGSFGTSGSGRFVMANAADSVTVFGTYTANGGPSVADLTAGKLVLRGNFVQGPSYANDFAASGTHQVVFAGSAPQTVSFSYPGGVGYSAFQDVTFANPAGVAFSTSAFAGRNVTVSSGTVTGAGRAVTIGATLFDAGGNGWKVDTTTFTATPASLPDSLHGTVHFQAPVALAKALRVSGSLFLDGSNGVLTAGGFPLTVTGLLREAGSGQLRMLSSSDSVDVGAFQSASAVSGAGLDTAGILVIRGGFHQYSTGSIATFAPSGGQRTRLVAAGADTVIFENPDLASGSHFNHLEVAAGSGTIVFASDVLASGTITKAPGAAPTLKGFGTLLRGFGLDVDGLVLDHVRLMKSGTAQIARFDSVTFKNQDSTADQFTLTQGGAGSPQTFNGIVFSNPVVFGTGHYMVVSDSAANSLPVLISMNRSTPLYGGSFTTIASGYDSAAVRWTGLAFATIPANGVTGTPLPTVRVAAVGPLGDTITNLVDTATALISTNPVGGTLTGVTSVPFVNGIATFDSLIVTGVGNGYVLMFGASGFQPILSSPLNIDIQIPPGINAVWRGATDSLWTTATNWQAGVVPDTAADVFIPAGMPHNPYIATSGYVRLNRLVVANGGTVKADTFATLMADSSIDNGGTITGGGTVQLAGAGNVRGIFNTVTVTGGPYVVTPGSVFLANRDLLVSGPSALLDLNGTSSGTNGNFTTANGGILVMTHAADTLNVTGNASFGGGVEAGELTAGRILLQGNFTQSGPNYLSFAAGPGHVTELLRGSGLQTVHFDSPDTAKSHFGTLLLSGADSVAFDTMTVVLGDFNVTGTNVAAQTRDTLAVAGNVTTVAGSRLWLRGLGVGGTLSAAGGYSVGTTGFVGAGQTIPALPYDTIQVLGSTTLGTDVTAARLIVGGSLPASLFDLGGHTLTLTGDAFVDTAGTLRMTSSSDTLRVGRHFTIQGRDSTGQLTAGLIDVGGDFNQPAGSASFLPSGSHTVRFNGGTHIVDLYSPDPAPVGFVPSAFQHLVITGGASVEGRSNVGVSGDLTVTASTLVDTTTHFINDAYVPSVVGVSGNASADGASTLNVARLAVAGTLNAPTAPAQYGVGTTVFRGTGQSVPVLPYNLVEVDGTALASAALTMNGLTVGNGSQAATFDPAGYPITITGPLNVAPLGILQMTTATDSVDVGNTAEFDGASSYGHLTAGTLVLRGSFLQSGGGSDSAFFATGSHRTIFTAPSSPVIAVGYAGTRFNRLTTLGTVTIQSGSRPVVVGDSLRLVQGGLTQGGSAHIVALGYFEQDSFATVQVDTLDLNAGVHVSEATTYIVGRTRFIGTGQTIALQTVPLQNVDILGTASLASLTFISDTLTVTGQLDLGGQKLYVDSLFRTEGTGTLRMASAADTLVSNNNTVFAGGSTSGLLTAGVLQTPIISQTGANSPSSFAASGTHRLEIISNPTGNGEQITFATPGSAASHPQIMQITGSTTVGLNSNLFVGDSLIYAIGDGYLSAVAGTHLTVAGALVLDVPNGLSVDTLELQNATPVINRTGSIGWTPTVTRFSGVGQAIPDSFSFHTIEVTGSAQTTGTNASADSLFIVGGSLHIGASTLDVNGDVRTTAGGTLKMDDPASMLDVAGAATFAGGSTAGLLTAGTIRFGGNSGLTQGGGSPSAFAPSGTAVTFDGSDYVQNITLADPDSSFFHDLSSTNGLGIKLIGRVRVYGALSVSGAIQGDTLQAFGTASFNNPVAPGAYTVGLKNVQVANGFTTNDTWAVPYTHFIGPTALPALAYNGNVVINAPVTLSATGPTAIRNLYVQGPGGPLYAGTNSTASFTMAPGVSQTVDTALQVDSGTVDLAGGRLTVGFDAMVETGSRLVMTQATDTLQVGRDLWMQGAASAGSLTDGRVLIGRDFHQAGDPQAYAPSGNHTTEFTSTYYYTTSPHTITFANPTTSGFANLTDNYPDVLTLASAGVTNVSGMLTSQRQSSAAPLVFRGGTAGLRFTEVNARGIVFDTIPVFFAMADSVVAFDSVAFNAPTSGFTQFTASGVAGATLRISRPIFTTIGAGNGIYVAATNTSGNGLFTVDAYNLNLGKTDFDSHNLPDAFSTILWDVP